MKKPSSIIILLILIFTSALISNVASAQYTLDWVMPSGNYNKTAVMSATDNQDNLFVAGFLQSENIYTAKYDISGNLLWEVSDASGIQGKYEKPLWICSDQAGYVIVTGKRYSISSSWEYPDAIVILKYSPSGALQWKQTIPVTVMVGSPHPAFRAKCLTDESGNVYVGSVAADPAGFVLAKLDPAGNFIFSKSYNGNTPLGFWDMHLDNNRVILAGGGMSAAPVIMVDEAGTLLWSVSDLGRGAHDVETDGEGNIYLLSSYPNQVSPSSGEDMIIYRYDLNGTQVFKKDYDFGGNEYPAMMSFAAGRLSISGTSNTASSLYLDWKIFQVDNVGNLMWHSTYDGTSYNDEYPHYIMARPDGNVIVTGFAGPSPDPNNLSYLQMVIVQYSNTGSTVWTDAPNQYGGTGVACMPVSDNSLFVISSANMTAYHYLPDQFTSVNGVNDGFIDFLGPNPFTDHITIRLKQNYPYTEAGMYNMEGKLILTRTFSGNNDKIDLSVLQVGPYICRIRSGDDVKSFKLFKR